MEGIVFSMIIVRVGLSVAWQNNTQNSSSLTTLQFNQQPATPARITTVTVDESQSTAKIVAIN